MSLADFLEFNLSHRGLSSAVILRCRKRIRFRRDQMFIVTKVSQFQATLGAKEKVKNFITLLKEL
jgi:hypothetical protein